MFSEPAAKMLICQAIKVSQTQTPEPGVPPYIDIPAPVGPAPAGAHARYLAGIRRVTEDMETRRPLLT